MADDKDTKVPATTTTTTVPHTSTTTSPAPKDKKKKQILIGAGVAGALVLAYLWYKNNSSSSSNPASSVTPSTTSTTTSGPAPVFNISGGQGGAGGVGGAGGTITQTLVSQPANKGGKTNIHKPVVKGSGYTSGGNTKISTSTATARPIKTTMNANGQMDTAAVASLNKANAARQRALKSGNKIAIANATKNVKSAQSVVRSRNIAHNQAVVSHNIHY